MTQTNTKKIALLSLILIIILWNQLIKTEKLIQKKTQEIDMIYQSHQLKKSRQTNLLLKNLEKVTFKNDILIVTAPPSKVTTTIKKIIHLYPYIKSIKYNGHTQKLLCELI